MICPAHIRDVVDPEARRIRKRCQQKLAATLQKYRLLETGEKVIVGVSGGADSLALIQLLNEYNQRHGQQWQLLPVHIALNFPGWKSHSVARILERMGIELRIIRVKLPQPTESPSQITCHLCSQLRRKQFFDLAAELRVKKIAYAHHIDDVNETYLLNLLFTASAATFLPRQDFFAGRVQIIRPLYYFDKPLLRDYCRIVGLKPVRNRCPLETVSNRMIIRRFLNRLYRRNPRIRTNLFAGIRNIKPEYLPTD